jgi:hypothetical protein
VGDKVVAVYMINDNTGGDWDIKCKYSNDRGQNWETSMVANEPDVDETFPSLYVTSGSIFCAYIKNGNLYIVKSTDGGMNWGSPEQINNVEGTVVAEENMMEIRPSGIVWTDSRDGNQDVYYSPVGTPPAKPSTPSGPTSGKINTKHTYTTSTTDPEGDQVWYWFDWGDGTNSGWEGPFASGAPGSSSHEWTKRGDYSIKVKAKDSAGFESPFSDPLSVSMPKSKKVIFPFFQRFFELFQNLITVLYNILRI